MTFAHFTICSRNYLAYALTLRASLLAADPSADFFIYLADDAEGLDLPSDVNVIRVADVAMPALWDMALRYSVMEFNTAIKPFCILDLWDKRGYDAAVYLDPDLYFLRPLTAVKDAFARGHDCVLTPHLLEPLADDFHPDDIQILRTGVYNLGFGAFAKRPGARRFIEWWGAECETKCVVDLENGLFVDQRLADYAPAFCDDAYILRDPGYNVAYWNLKHRRVAKTADGWTVANSAGGGAPLTFFHFSGVVPGDASVFSKHQNRFTVADLGPAKALLNDYLALLDRNGHAAWKKTPYAFDCFSDGQRITPEMRKVYAKSNHARITSRERAFRPRYELFNALAPIAHDGAKDFPVTRLMHEIYLGRKDLHDLFPLSSAEGRRNFAFWFVASAPKEHHVSEACLSPVRRAIARESGATIAAATPGEPAPPPKTGVRSSLRPLVRSVYHGVPLLRAVYDGLPASVRMKARKAIINADSQADAAEAGKTPTIAPADGRIDRARRPGVDVYGYFRAESGVGEGARRSALALKAAGIDLHTFAVGTQGVFKETIDWSDDDPATPPRRIALANVNADQMPLMGRFIDPHRLAGSYLIGYWAWELSLFPDAWLPAFDLVDEIWAPSSFTAAAIRARTKKPVRVIPHPAVNGLTAVPDRARFGLPEHRLAIYANLDLNSYVARKNPDAAVAAFRQAFPDAPGAPFLILKTHGGKHLEEARRRIRGLVDGARNIAVIDGVLPAADLAAMQASADIYLSLHRAEGFGLGIAEFMALGKPVVVTGYSGNMDFTDDTTAAIVGYDLISVRPGEYPHSEGAQWAEPRIADAVRALKELGASAEFRTALGRRGQARVREKLSIEAVGALMRARLEEIDADLKTPAIVSRLAG
jgi:glycosyltransferase involved in cell wall biosynthesis